METDFKVGAIDRATSVLVALGVADDGQEAIVAFLHHDRAVPLVTVMPENHDVILRRAEELALLKGRKIRVVKFSQREEIKEF